MIVNTKICSDCRRPKPINEYFLQNTRKNYLQSVCKKCNAKANKESYNKYLEQNRKKRANWQAKNRLLHNKHQRQYYARKRENLTWGLI